MNDEEIIRFYKISLTVLLLIIISFFLLNCSSESDDLCECTKTTERLNQYPVMNPVTGLPTIQFNWEELSTEQVGCQDEQTRVSQGNSIYITIKCD